MQIKRIKSDYVLIFDFFFSFFWLLIKNLKKNLKEENIKEEKEREKKNSRIQLIRIQMVSFIPFDKTQFVFVYKNPFETQCITFVCHNCFCFCFCLVFVSSCALFQFNFLLILLNSIHYVIFVFPKRDKGEERKIKTHKKKTYFESEVESELFKLKFKSLTQLRSK